jgi:hypothetical protein
VLETRRQSALVSSPLPLGALHCPSKQVLSKDGIECASSYFVFTCVAANQGDGFFGEGGANNQAAQAIDQSRFGGGINQGQAGEREIVSDPHFDGSSNIIANQTRPFRSEIPFLTLAIF